MTTFASTAVFLIVTLAATAAAKTFTGPSGWEHVDQSVPPGSSEKVDQWKQGSGDLQQSLIVLSDSAVSYNDILDRIHKNVSDAKLHVTVDKDQTCDGKTSHMIELVYGPDIKRVKVDRLVVPDGSGSVQITYIRPEPEPFSDDVKTALNAYCGTT
ncbi:MAG: hypothetical protein JOY59_00280 [Candidatus Eremiobacteraeota bacterium]|nr:hypothetical protein [Candidatus Eremiobacteraeota bacterium]